ncbi:hypothetical protein FJTKL_02850 [Diaporthe vaccinii]|uniref:Uncharacterized protein n=1 Tax=Diaporthe vaccinii TaxID=105482 RepID=A0ABR4F2V2_9PEZI
MKVFQASVTSDAAGTRAGRRAGRYTKFTVQQNFADDGKNNNGRGVEVITGQRTHREFGFFHKSHFLIKEIYHHPDRLCQGSQKTPRSQSICGAIGFIIVAAINEDVASTPM